MIKIITIIIVAYLVPCAVRHLIASSIEFTIHAYCDSVHIVQRAEETRAERTHTHSHSRMQSTLRLELLPAAAAAARPVVESARREGTHNTLKYAEYTR